MSQVRYKILCNLYEERVDYKILTAFEISILKKGGNQFFDWNLIANKLQTQLVQEWEKNEYYWYVDDIEVRSSEDQIHLNIPLSEAPYVNDFGELEQYSTECYTVCNDFFTNLNMADWFITARVIESFC